MPVVVERGRATSERRQRRSSHPPAVPPAVTEDVLRALPLRDYQRDAVRASLSLVPDRSHVHVTHLPTGAGKTVVAVALVACLLAAGYRVLWVCKRWDLLRQAAEAILKFLPQHARTLRRFGGACTPLRDLPDEPGGRVRFTSLQTWYKHRHRLPAEIGPSARLAVVWDEVHWGVRSKMGRAFRRHYVGTAATYGLSATPVVGDDVQIAYRKPPAELYGTFLATPLIREVVTGSSWSPEIVNEDFSPGSLHELGQDADRNDVIVQELVRGRADGAYRRTLVFACDIPHAIALHRLLAERGLAARVVHCQQPRLEQEAAIRLFREGGVDVLVNVGMLTEGFDVPEIDSVLLARPTRSVRLLIQMIGRGARRAPGKDSFWVVDFADNVRRAGDGAVRARTVVEDSAADAHPPPRRRPTRHLAPTGLPRFENVTIPNYGVVPVAADQTFGVEIELTAPGYVPRRGRGWRATARAIIDRLGEAAQVPVHAAALEPRAAVPTEWVVKDDRSAGWEVVSPILMGAEGFEELRRVCDGLTALVADMPERLRVNYRTGLHATVATRLTSDHQLRGLINRVQRLEPGLFTLTSPSRLYPYLGPDQGYALREGNKFCLSLRRLGDVSGLSLADFVVDDGNRYRTVNLTRSWDDVQLLEVRMHGGTTEYRKVALWLSLWMQVFNRSRYAWAAPGKSGPVFAGRNRRLSPAQASREDIVALLTAEGIPLTPEFARLLQARREELRASWRRVLPLRVQSWADAGWYSDD